MNLHLKTIVHCPLDKVIKGLDKDLFERLAPPFPKTNIERFDGYLVGHEIHVWIELFGKKSKWISKITEQQKKESSFYFVDEGVVLPTPLTRWIHRHQLNKISLHKTEIIDEIEFSCPTKSLELLVFPVLWTLFNYRKPIYRNYFNQS